MLNNQAIAYIRTIVPYGIGAAIGWLLTLGLDLRGEFQLTFIAFATVATQNIYYWLVRLLETHLTEGFRPLFILLIGVPAQPNYGVRDLWTSFVRTGIPTLVTLAVVFLVDLVPFLHFDADTTAGLIAVFVAAIESLYYAAARAIIERYPTWSRLLGTAVGIEPTYLPKHAA